LKLFDRRSNKESAVGAEGGNRKFPTGALRFSWGLKKIKQKDFQYGSLFFYMQNKESNCGTRGFKKSEQCGVFFRIDHRSFG